MKLHGKVAVVTGAATGLGRATAIASAREGARLILADIDEEGGAETVGIIRSEGGTVDFVPTDISEADEVRRLMDFVNDRWGFLDILVNPAAILLDPGTSIDHFSETSWQRVLSVNLTGSFLCVKNSVPLMEKAGGGVILLIISGAGVVGGSASLPYGASKGGVRGLALVLHEQLRPKKIRIHAVSPADMATKMKLGAVREVAEKEGRSADEAEETLLPLLQTPNTIADVLVDLSSAAGDAASDTVTIFSGDWNLTTRTLSHPNRKLL